MNALNWGDISWMLTSSALVLLMTPGLAFFYGGLVKRKNVANTMMSSIFIMGLASILWVLIGYTLSFSGDVGGIIGNFNWFGLSGVDAQPGPYAGNDPEFVFRNFSDDVCYHNTCPYYGWRSRKNEIYIFIYIYRSMVDIGLLSAGTYGLGGGIIQQLGALDFAGGNVVHISSGISALVLAIILGKRKNQGKAAYHPHNVPFVLLGAAILWFGWFGFNAGSAGAANDIAVRAFMTTNTSAAAAMLSWIFIEKIRTGKPTLVGACTGLVIGLAAITPGAGFVPIWAAIIIGGAVSPICYYFITYIKPKLGYDDALDAFGCHGIGGIWGSIATGIFTQASLNSAAKWNGLIYGEWTLFRQLASIGITIVIAVVGTLIAVGIAKLFTKNIRVSLREESIGLDISEHGENAYPAFNGMEN